MEPAEPAEPAEPPESADPAGAQAPAETAPEPAEPKQAKRRPRSRVKVVAPGEPLPVRQPKRVNTRTATPPSIEVDNAFWTGLIASNRNATRDRRVERYRNFQIT